MVKEKGQGNEKEEGTMEKQRPEDGSSDPETLREL